jgi:enolase
VKKNQSQTKRIREIQAREILDSRGNPTVEADVELESGHIGRAAVPSGASTGRFEAVEIRDGEPHRYRGKGVREAVANVEERIRPELIGEDALDQIHLDRLMRELDGTEDKSSLGANAMLAVSLAAARAGATYQGVSLYRYLGGVGDVGLPVPLLNILNGGEHADNNLDFQEIMIAPVGVDTFTDAMQCASEVFYALKELLERRGYRTGVGDEGGFSPNLDSNTEALELVVEAIQESNYNPQDHVQIALDCAATEFYDSEAGRYILDADDSTKSSSELIGLYSELLQRFPIVSIEDGLAEDDWDGWSELTAEIGDRVQLVGDDLFVTNTDRISTGIERGAGNSVLIKPNQIGTLTETIEAVETAHRNRFTAVISHRSGETADSFIADLAVGLNTGQIKAGSVSRSERVAKYNRLLRIEAQLGGEAYYVGRHAF